MGTVKLFFHFLLLSIVHASNDCSYSSCGSNNFPIRFPFQLGSQQPQYCGYPGFGLKCNDQGMTVLNLPNSGEFFVREIDYLRQQILLFDPKNCLPRRLLNLNLSSSPFTASSYLNYTFLGCSPEFVMARFTTISCLSNSSVSVIATSSMKLAKQMNTCTTIGTYAIPTSWPLRDSGSGFSSDLSYDLQLDWDVPNCQDCELHGGLCGFNSTSRTTVCFDNPGTGHPRSGLQAFKIIALAVVIPAITCSIAVSCFICFSDCCDRRRHSNTAVQNSTVTPQPAPLTAGLDNSTIESYTKVVLGESRRVPGPNHITCPICLADYHPKETVRCIPECEHCFHAECIDEWLRRNGTCPVCRSSPSPAHDANLQNVSEMESSV